MPAPICDCNFGYYDVVGKGDCESKNYKLYLENVRSSASNAKMIKITARIAKQIVFRLRNVFVRKENLIIMGVLAKIARDSAKCAFQRKITVQFVV